LFYAQTTFSKTSGGHVTDLEPEDKSQSSPAAGPHHEYRHVGEWLIAERLKRRTTISEVEAAIRVKAEYLDAFERMDTRRLPEGAYARGFLRTYARFLELDPDHVVEAFLNDLALSNRSGKRFAPPPDTHGTGIQLPASTVAGLIGVSLLLVLIWMGWPRGGGADTDVPGVPEGLKEWSQRPPGEGLVETPLDQLPISIEARTETRIRVTRPSGYVLFEGVLPSGEIYPIPAGDVVLSADNGGALMLLHEGRARGRMGPIGVPIEGWTPNPVLDQWAKEDAAAEAATLSADDAAPQRPRGNGPS
jgi:cytoskeleton protein RodZ